MTAKIRDVTLRDGLQLSDGQLPAEDRVRLVRALLELGFDSLEIGSMARPDLVPSMAPSMDVVAALTPEELAHCWIWVATPKQVRRAAEAGVRGVQYCLSVTDEHNRANIGRDTETSMAALPEALEIAAEHDVAVQLCLATSFTCPFTGPVAPERVLALVADARGQGCSDVVIADTLGQASPGEVASLTGRVVAAAGTRPVTFHGHDTWGMGVANALAAIEAGAQTVDGALGGLGGCPFAPGASGNTATEDLAFAIRPEGVRPESFRSLVELGEQVLGTLGEVSRSRAGQGSRSRATAFDWTFAAAS